MKLTISVGSLAIALIGGTVVFAQADLVGTTAPAPILVTMDQRYQFLSKLYYSGEERPREPRAIVALNFMGLKCAHCRKEMPIFLEIMRPLAERSRTNSTPIRYFLISTDPLSSKAALGKFFDEQKIDVASEVLLDPYKKAAEKFGVTNIPRTLVISSKGQVMADIKGAPDGYKQQLIEGVRAALKAR